MPEVMAPKQFENLENKRYFFCRLLKMFMNRDVNMSDRVLTGSGKDQGKNLVRKFVFHPKVRDLFKVTSLHVNIFLFAQTLQM